MTVTTLRPKNAAPELAKGGSPQRRFWRLCEYLGERREAAGEICWDLRAWRSWCKAAREAGFGFFGYVGRIEALLAEGKTAEEIRQHFVLLKQSDAGRREAELRAEREERERVERREREKTIAAEADKQFIREQARMRAKKMLGEDDETKPNRRRFQERT